MIAEEHPSHVIKKKTIIKDRVGCVRSSIYNLPSAGHTYGMKSTVSPEGVGDSKFSGIFNLIFTLINNHAI
jgi:hypothetical protein